MELNEVEKTLAELLIAITFYNAPENVVPRLSYALEKGWRLIDPYAMIRREEACNVGFTEPDDESTKDYLKKNFC